MPNFIAESKERIVSNEGRRVMFWWKTSLGKEWVMFAKHFTPFGLVQEQGARTTTGQTAQRRR
jgi:hypothetical protein